MLSFFQNGKPPYSVEKISEGKFLDRAKEAGVDVFFNCWMQKKVRKAMVGTWFILHVNEDFVFWGKPVFKRIFSDKRIVEEFFKTDLNKLNLEFPDFKSKPGNAVRLKLCEYIQNSLNNPARITVSLGFKVKLTDTAIDVETPCTKTPKSSVDNPNPIPVKANYRVILDKYTLDLIELEELN
jgi:hypothetical protein